jgi:anti-sigma factor RsiW
VSHLGPRISALVDGELDPSDAERALAHVASCPQCHADLDAERHAKSRVSALAGPPVPDELMRRLVAMAEPGEPLRRREGDLAGARRVRPAPAPFPGREHGARPPLAPYASRGPRRSRRALGRRTTMAGGMLSAVGVAMGAAFLLGGTEQPNGPALLPPVTTFSQEHAARTSLLPLGDPAMSATQAGWSGSLGGGFTPQLVRVVPYR